MGSNGGGGVLVVPDGGWGWLVLVAACLSNVMVQVSRNSQLMHLCKLGKNDVECFRV